MSERFLNNRIQLHCGDCRDVLASLEENSIDSVVTDPPYHLTSPAVGWETYSNGRGGTKAGNITKKGFMGKTWDGGDIAFRPELWAQVYRVLKPGAHLLAFGGTRTYHRMACAIEDAGFEIRDCVQWLYGSGFPKSHDVSKGIDRAAGAEREVVGIAGRCGLSVIAYARDDAKEYMETRPATPAARQWDGWGTALKPACEPIVLARKPLSESTVAANVLKWGTGAINVDGCRVGVDGGTRGANYAKTGLFGIGGKADIESIDAGRWPANVIHDGSEEVVGAFPETAPSSDQVRVNRVTTQFGFGDGKPDGRLSNGYVDDGGSAARFFYTSKADGDDRLGSKHPTVKPLDLMQYLVRLITPPKGTCLDPFAGTGTTGEAAWREGMSAVLIERETEYQDDIRRRMKLALSGPDECARESIKQRMKDKPRDDGPLFGGVLEYPPADRVAYGKFAEGGGGSHKRKPRDDGPLFDFYNADRECLEAAE